MCLSIALLLGLQYVWLRQVYEERRAWLQKETTDLLQDAIMELQDSIFQSKIQRATVQKKDTTYEDSLKTDLPFKTDTLIFIAKDEMRVILPSPKEQTLLDTAKRRMVTRFFRSDLRNLYTDSVRIAHMSKNLQRLVMNVKSNENKREVVIKLNNDSLSIKMVERKFAKKLAAHNLPVSFAMRKFYPPEMPKIEDALLAGPVPGGVPPRDFFAAQLLHHNNYLLQKNLPQLLFSLLLTGITILSFALIYNNLRQQQRLTALKNDFISNITHELKTPIATVSVAVEALRNFNALQNPQLTREYLDISKNELNRLTMLVDKVLKMSVFEQKALELNLEMVDVADLLQQIMTSMKLQFEKYQAQVNVQTSGTDFIITADRLHLTSVMYNLLDNALKYSREEPEINVHLEQQNGYLNLSVQDNGIGIAPAYQQRIFEKFFRVPTGDVHNVKGYGLGLHYVASVVQQHGGSITVESTAGQGSCFKISLPGK